MPLTTSAATFPAQLIIQLFIMPKKIKDNKKTKLTGNQITCKLLSKNTVIKPKYTSYLKDFINRIKNHNKLESKIV